MSEELEELVIKLSADVSGLTAGFAHVSEESKKTAEKVESHLSKMKEGFEKLHKTVELVAGIIGIELGYKAFKELIWGSMESIDAMDKLSDKLGVTTESLYGLKILCDDTGVSLDSVTAGMQKMAIALAEAGRKSGDASHGLAELGLDLKELKSARPDEAFGMISDALNKLTDHQEKARLAQVFFGRGARELTNIIRAGSEGMEEAKKSAEDLGFALTKVETTKVAKAKDELELLGSALKVIGMRLAVESAPFIEAIAHRAVDAAKDVHGFKDAIKDLVESAVQGAGFIINTWWGFKVLWAGLKVAFAEFTDGVWHGLDLMVRMIVERIEIVKNVFGALIETGKSMGSSFEVIWSALKLPVAMFVQFTAEQLGKLLRVAGETASQFDAELGAKIQGTADSIAASTGTMAVDAKANLSKVAEAAAQQGEKTKEAWKNIFDTSGMTDKAHQIVELLGLDKADAYLSRTKEELDEITKTGPPGTAMVQWLHDVQDEADEAAKKVAAIAPGGEGGQGEEDTGMTAYQKELSDKLAALDLYQNEDLTKEADWYQQNQDMLVAAKEQGLLTESEYNLALEDLNIKHTARLSQIDADGSRKNLAMWQTGWSGKAKIVSDVLGQVAGLMNSKNRQMFEVGKAAAYASTIINTAQAAMGAYSAYASIPYVGPVLGAAAAAAAVVAGAVQLSTISSTSFGGGGSVGGSFSASAPSASGVAPTASGTSNAQIAGSSQSTAPPSAIEIHMKGRDGLTKQELIDLSDKLEELKKDGVNPGKITFVS